MLHYPWPFSRVNQACDSVTYFRSLTYLEDISDPARAVKAVVAALTEAQALSGIVIAQTHYSAEEESEDRDVVGYTVLWPSDYQGEFNIW